MLFVGSTANDVAWIALAIFLVAVGLALAFAFVVLGLTLARAAGFIRRTEDEVMPVIGKVGGTVDRVNLQLDKVDVMTTSAADAVTAADRAVRAVSAAVASPVKKVSGLVAGVSHGAADFRVNRDWHSAVEVARQAAERREQDLEEELRRQDQG